MVDNPPIPWATIIGNQQAAYEAIIKQRRYTMKVKEESVMAQKTQEFVAVLPYSDYSKGGRALSKALEVHFGKRNLGYVPQGKTHQDMVFINWGWSQNPLRNSPLPIKTKHVFNKYADVANCGDKLKFFDMVKDTVRIPVYTKDFEEAMAWVEQDIQVMGRRARGSCGEDICWPEDIEAFANSQFWVQYKKKESEFRIHVAFDKVISIQKKALRKTDAEGKAIDTSNVDFRIRNLRNGFVFQRHGITVPDDVTVQAIAAVKKANLDFGAVDVIYNRTENKAYVLEINTSPGLEGTTVEDYTNAFKEELARVTRPL